MKTKMKAKPKPRKAVKKTSDGPWERDANGEAYRPFRSKDGGERKIRSIRFSDAEWAYLQDAAEKRETSASALVRVIALRGMAVENEDAAP